MTKPKPTDTRLAPCPICQKPSDWSYRPFCSRRCSDIDLGRWFNESYRIPAGGDPADEDFADPGPAADRRPEDY